MAMVADPSTAPAKDEVSSSIPPRKSPANHKEEIIAVARKFADDPVQNSDPSVWAVLTAISALARRRRQGMNILFSEDEHRLGRCVENTRFQIIDNAISSNHCKILRERATAADGDPGGSSTHIFLKDTSTNGTYLNWERLRKNTPRARLQHGDIISFIAPPHDDKSYAFVYREVCKHTVFANGASTKRKAVESIPESKRQKGIGIGASEGPISLDDVRSLQRSNTELRQQLESHVLTIETLRSENRESVARHENELKELKETVSGSFLDQVKELQHAIAVKQKELDELNMSSANLRNTNKDINERLSASMQSRVDADEIICSQKATISDLETQLHEERNQRRDERDKAEANLKSALQRAHSEAQAEIKRQADVHLRQHQEQQEVISKLQEAEKESRFLVETLRSKLKDTRENLVNSEEKVRQLEVQLFDEQTSFASSKKKCETLESDLKKLRNELESEKAAREEAWSKVSALELEIAAALRDLSTERQRFQGARERIILRETQLRAFYSTTEEISALFAKQQEQLKAMQKTLEDEENCENISVGFDLNEPDAWNINVAYGSAREEANSSKIRRQLSGAPTPKNSEPVEVGSGDEDDDVSTTEKHDCDMRSQDGNSQDMECTSADRVVRGFGPNNDGVGTRVVPNEEHTDTERVLGTESQVGDAGNDRNATLHSQIGETLQLDVETQAEENLEPCEKAEGKADHCSESRNEDTETGTIRTADLLASEVAGSWAVGTAPSVHGENESPRCVGDAAGGDEDIAAAALVLCSEGEGQAAGSQTNVVCAFTEMSDEHKALNAMIDIVAPEFKQKFQVGAVAIGENDSMSDAETEDGSNPGESSDGDGEDEDGTDYHPTEDGNDAMIEDSVG